MPLSATTDGHFVLLLLLLGGGGGSCCFVKGEGILGGLYVSVYSFLSVCPNRCSQPAPCAAVEKDCTGGLIIEMFDDSDEVGADVLLLHR